MDPLDTFLDLADIDQTKKLEEKRITQIYQFLLSDEYYMSPNYTLINKLFQLIVLNNRWDAYIALNYFDYLLFEGWDYEALIVRTLLLENNICLAGEFCLDTELVKNGYSYIRNSSIWNGRDYYDENIPLALSKWKIYYDDKSHEFHVVE
ncbi:hypothetical protein [Veillonella sp. Ser01]